MAEHVHNDLNQDAPSSEKEAIVKTPSPLEIKGDATSLGGDLAHPGPIEIFGDVISGLRVKSNSDIVIHGSAEACHLTAGGNVVIKGGMAGKRTGTVDCVGSLKAKYLSGVRVRCQSDVIAQNELVDCLVKTSGSLTVEAGHLIGGDCMAERGVSAMEIGSPSGVKTKVAVGMCYLSMEKNSDLKNELSVVSEQISRISDRLDPLLRNPRAMMTLDDARKAAVRKLAEKMKELIAYQEELRDGIEDNKKHAEKRANRIISARRGVYQGVILTIGGTSEEIKSPIIRPVSVVRNPRSGEFRFVSWRAVTCDAKELELDIATAEIESERRRKARERRERAWLDNL